MDLTITGGRVLRPDGFATGDVAVVGSALAERGFGGHRLDARGLLVLPGIVDLHGDAFERQILPRPGVAFPIDVALLETDRQLVANGITTAFHSVTWAWEPGLRDARTANALVGALETLAPRLACDTRLHLRHETHNLPGEAEVIDWLAAGRLALLSFNDHVADAIEDLGKPAKVQRYLDRTGLDRAGWIALVETVAARAGDVPASVMRIAAAGRAAGVPMMSHDDLTPAVRDWYAGLGVAISEFPETVETARHAVASGAATVFGAPNVVRGGSHTTAPAAALMVREGLCTVLASDYYYPAPLLASFALDAAGIVDLAAAWRLVSTHPAAAAGLRDRGEIAEGRRADLVLVDPTAPRPRVVATLVAGRIVYLTDGSRLMAR